MRSRTHIHWMYHLTEIQVGVKWNVYSCKDAPSHMFSKAARRYCQGTLKVGPFRIKSMSILAIKVVWVTTAENDLARS
jgi:hypothetical protein